MWPRADSVAADSARDPRPTGPARTPSANRGSTGRRGANFYLAIAGVIGGVVVFGVTLWAYYTETSSATKIAFSATCLVASVLFFTFLWGFSLAMSGVISRNRIAYLVAHGALGSISPLLYTLIISAELQDTLNRPVSDLDLGLAFASVWVLVIQFMSGLVTRFGWPWRR